MLAVLVGVGVRAEYIASVGADTPVGGDGYYYHTVANSLAGGRGFVSPFGDEAATSSIQLTTLAEISPDLLVEIPHL